MTLIPELLALRVGDVVGPAGGGSSVSPALFVSGLTLLALVVFGILVLKVIAARRGQRRPDQHTTLPTDEEGREP